jgi:hypothetical protein
MMSVFACSVRLSACFGPVAYVSRTTDVTIVPYAKKHLEPFLDHVLQAFSFLHHCETLRPLPIRIIFSKGLWVLLLYGLGGCGASDLMNSRSKIAHTCLATSITISAFFSSQRALKLLVQPKNTSEGVDARIVASRTPGLPKPELSTSADLWLELKATNWFTEEALFASLEHPTVVWKHLATTRHIRVHTRSATLRKPVPDTHVPLIIEVGDLLLPRFRQKSGIYRLLSFLAQHCLGNK